jgi:hypothetical protein
VKTDAIAVVSKKNFTQKTYFLLASWKPLMKRAGFGSGTVIRINNSVYRSNDLDPDPFQNVTDP